MKKGYKRLYVFELIMFIILIANSLIGDFLGRYGLIILLSIILIVFKKIFGFERDRHRFTKDIILSIIIYSLVFFMIYYIIGIGIGFARTEEYFTWYGISQIVLPLIITIVLEEYLRFAILTKSEGCNGLYISTTILFIALYSLGAINNQTFETGSSLFMFVGLTLLPAITNNILCTYICIKDGFKPNILFRLLTGLYMYLLPIVPNPNEYLKSLVDFLLPVGLIIYMYKFRVKISDEDLKRDYRKKSLGFLIPVVTIAALTYFVSGYFRFFTVAIASDSMNPVIKLGDVVVIDQKISKDKLEKGSVIAFRHNGAIIVHRLYNIIEDGNETFYYTKGDANNTVDSWTLKQEDIVGSVNSKISWIGLPTVWINGLLNE